MKNYSQQFLLKIFSHLPEDLQKALFSLEITNFIKEICKRNNIAEKSDEIIRYVGYTLFGLLSPQKLQITIEKDLFLPAETARKITEEINRVIFTPLKRSLEELYRGKESSVEEEKKPKVKKDIYRESI